jgi:riboflavin synthase
LDGFDLRPTLHYVQRWMFTGLVEDRGTLVAKEARGPGSRLVFRSKLGVLALGESIAIDGACLTVVESKNDTFDMDATAETLARTTLGDLVAGSTVNLERALKVGDRLGGHLVTGHVDGVGALVKRTPVGESVAMSFSMPHELSKFVAEKGSITVSGVSLTVNGVQGDAFDVVIIPHTLEVTTLGSLAVGGRVNLEVDLVARYVARLQER